MFQEVPPAPLYIMFATAGATAFALLPFMPRFWFYDKGGMHVARLVVLSLCIALAGSSAILCLVAALAAQEPQFAALREITQAAWLLAQSLMLFIWCLGLLIWLPAYPLVVRSEAHLQRLDRTNDFQNYVVEPVRDISNKLDRLIDGLGPRQD